MGQTPSNAASPSLPEINLISSNNKSTASMKELVIDNVFSSSDYISNLPDDCLAFVFKYLGSGDRKRCSLVCRRWLTVEGHSRHRISLNAKSDLISTIPSLFSRFDVVTKLALKCDRRSISLSDDALFMISLLCKNLTRLKLRGCREITNAGVSAASTNWKNLKKLSIGSCSFGAKGMNAILENCSLEELSVKRLRGLTGGIMAEPIGVTTGSSLKTICLKELFSGQCFGPLIIGSKNLKTLKLISCSGDWDKILEIVANGVVNLVEIHLERLQVSDFGLKAVSNCSNLQIFHLVKTPECTNWGIESVAEKCKLLRKVHIDGWKTNRISDVGLIAISKHCPNLQELVLIGVNPTKSSIESLAVNCQNLERLALCGSETVGDDEISCIAAKCLALRKLCIKNCPVSNQGMEALAGGCPNLVKVKVNKCKRVTGDGVDWLRCSRGGSVAVNLDGGESEQQNTSASNSVAQENGLEVVPVVVQLRAANTGRSISFKSRLGRMACTFRRCSSFNGSSLSS